MVLAGTSVVLMPSDAEAKRLGGGRPAGMQRQAPAEPARPAAPNNAQQPAPAAPAAVPPQAGKRSWMGPIAGLAAGLGIAALMSHLGMGEAFGNFLTMALFALVAFVAIRWIMGRMRGNAQPAGRGVGPQWATAGAPVAAFDPTPRRAAPVARNSLELPSLQPVMRTADALGSASQFSADAVAAPRATMTLPEGFDVPAFERLAKMVFIRLQAANDTGAVDDLRKFTTPELFASLRLDLQERGGVEQHTDVVDLDAKLVDTAQENGQWIASVRFRGLISEERGAEAVPFDELWHLVKPLDDNRADSAWAIAGITPQH
jgi:predicted lipid-binding transport protein (Tim44 family)